MSLCIVESCNSEALIGAKKCHYHLHRNIPHLHLVGTEIEEPEHVCELTSEQVSSLVGFAYHLRNLPDYTRQWTYQEVLQEVERITGSKSESDFYLLRYLFHMLIAVFTGAVLGNMFL